MTTGPQERHGADRAETGAVLRHQEHLAQEWGRHVEYDEAANDWQRHYAVKWRNERLARLLERQREEIQRHKWIESEKARRDLGRDAVMDWIQRYAAAWRSWYQEHEEPPPPEAVYEDRTP